MQVKRRKRVDCLQETNTWKKVSKEAKRSPNFFSSRRPSECEGPFKGFANKLLSKAFVLRRQHRKKVQESEKEEEEEDTKRAGSRIENYLNSGLRKFGSLSEFFSSVDVRILCAFEGLFQFFQLKGSEGGSRSPLLPLQCQSRLRVTVATHIVVTYN